MLLNNYPTYLKQEIITNNFFDYFDKQKYIKIPSVKISSRIDKSVFLIGSTISVLKEYIIKDTIPSNGLYIFQRVIRSRLLDQIFIENYTTEWSSFWRSIGGLVKYDQLERITEDLFNYFVNYLCIPESEIAIKCSSEDLDLYYVLSKIFSKSTFLIDTKPRMYYRHRYGLEDLGIFGRNANFALKSKHSQEYRDIGNIIIIQSDNKHFGVEYAFSPGAIISRLNNYSNVIKGEVINDIMNIDNVDLIRLADCIVVCMNLLYEGLIPNSVKMQKRILKKYLVALNYFKDKLNYTSDEVLSISNQYLKKEYNLSIFNHSLLLNYLS